MKPVRALFACSMLSTLYFVACGSDDGKNIVRNTDGGAGGEAGEPALPSAGAAGEPPVSSGGAPEAGAGGVGGEGGLATVGGEAGAGGQPPVCSGFVTPAEAGAGGEGAVVPLHFRCEDLQDAGAYYDIATRKIVVPTLPGMEGAVSGSFPLFYSYTVDTTYTTECVPGTVSRVGDELELSAPLFAGNQNAIDNLDELRISQLTLEDECGNTVKMDNSWTNPQDDLCWYIAVRPSDDLNTWAIDCYEGGGDVCGAECPK
jgi:hypothetical protein